MTDKEWRNRQEADKKRLPKAVKDNCPDNWEAQGVTVEIRDVLNNVWKDIVDMKPTDEADVNIRRHRNGKKI